MAVSSSGQCGRICKVAAGSLTSVAAKQQSTAGAALTDSDSVRPFCLKLNPACCVLIPKKKEEKNVRAVVHRMSGLCTGNIHFSLNDRQAKD